VRRVLLFVYGTLRRDAAGKLSPLLGESARFVDEARVRGHVVPVGPYLALVTGSGNETVAGELIEIAADVLPRLDAYEGCAPDDPQPHGYRREMIEATRASGEVVQTWAYVFNRDTGSVSPLRYADTKQEERVMALAELLLAQLEREIPPTRKMVERVPDGKDDWKPHPKSMPMGYLTNLVSVMFGWIAMMVDRDELDLATGKRPEASTVVERLAALDAAVEEARRALSNTSDDHLQKPWRLLVGGKVVDERPRHIMIADTFSHLAHHRGQLTVYLRLNDRKVPSSYGPTADEGWQG
jgi:gamma-glutamylcyclotransferase (GGCT)/AIG2-like uncharacterized protein YtfP/uncharacterized damage-inducible protein DinB